MIKVFRSILIIKETFLALLKECLLYVENKKNKKFKWEIIKNILEIS